MPSKSIFRQPGARHFQVVHRSQRDPLINDPEASQHVLKPIIKGKTRAELEQELSPADLARENVGEAAEHGVYYDDTEYDYMQHLREVGLREDGVESMLIDAPAAASAAASSSKGNGKGKGRAPEPGLSLVRDLPPEALPSAQELTRAEALEAQAAIPAALAGFRPDMDPHLRQTMEALEDDAFVDEALEDDFFAELVTGGERAEEDEEKGDFEFEFREEGVEEGLVEGEGGEGEPEDDSWQARFARFKLTQEARAKAVAKRSDVGSDNDDAHSEGADTVGQLPTMSVIGGKKRRKGASDASGYSMSSASMFRNEGLTLLDERFDQMEKEYNSDEDEEESDDSSSEAPELLTSREDFDAIMNDFLDNYEVAGGKMRPVLPGETVTDKLGTIRQSLREIGYDPHAQLADDVDDDDVDAFDEYIEEKGDRWDCETILTTYSNLENHPRLIRARQVKPTPKIHINPKTGLPSLQETEHRRTAADDDKGRRASRTTVPRPKNETKEEKLSRKHAVKEERKSRRADKKTTKEQFSSEKKQLMYSRNNGPAKGVRKL